MLNSLLNIIFEEVKTFKPPQKHKHRIRNIGKSPTSVYPMIFFDGAAANNMGSLHLFCSAANNHGANKFVEETWNHDYLKGSMLM